MGGGEGRLRGPNSFNFIQFFGTFDKIVCWRPDLGEILDPPLLVIVFRFLPGPMNGVLSFYDCRFSGKDTMWWGGHSNPTYCN